MAKVRYVGSDELYSGFDGDRMVNLTQGEEGEVSKEKAAQLAEDRPYDFEIDGKPAAKRPASKPAASEQGDGPDAVTLEKLLSRNRGQLDELAREHGIDPSGMSSKRDVANAILAALDEAAGV